MKIYKVTEADVQKALETVQPEFDNNLNYRVEPVKSYLKVRLTVKDSGEKGARHSNGNRCLKFACWHATGRFVDELFKVAPKASLYSRGTHYTADTWQWDDWNAGSDMKPAYISELCLCDRLEEVAAYQEEKGL